MRALLLTLIAIPTTLGIASHQSCFRAPVIPVHVSATEAKCLATMVYGEARGESEQGMVAVAFTAVNRAAKKTVCQVVLAPKQYSIFNNNPALKAAAMSAHLQPMQKNIIDQAGWKKALEIAHTVLSKAVADPTGGSTHYLAPIVMAAKGYHYPRWSKEFELVVVINNHRFYKPKNIS